MPKNIFDSALGESEIFKSEEFLFPEYVPERLPFRDAQVDGIVHALRPLLSGSRPNNVFVHGASGTGKTATVRFVMRELEEKTDRAKSLYVNCFEFNTRHSVLTQAANFLGMPVPRRGIATDEAYTNLLQGLKKTGFTPIIILDEADQLLPEGNASKLLYDFLRIIEYQKSRLGIVLISNNPLFVSQLDSRVKSSLMEESVEFFQYNPMQLKEILNYRCQFAFRQNVISDNLIGLAAAFAAKNNGDARIAIESLWKAGRMAEKERCREVSEKHLRSAFQAIEARAIQKSSAFIDAHEKKIISELAKKSPQTSGVLYLNYKSEMKGFVSERSFRKLVTRLEQLKLVSTELLEGPMRGKTRKISLAVPLEQAKKIVG